jgi:Family of unknown function (DUF5681)
MARRDYEVSYGRPPKRSRFRKGLSGNPRGRPRKSGAPPGDQVGLSEEIRQMLARASQSRRMGRRCGSRRDRPWPASFMPRLLVAT